jgi:hypothetical protein
MIIVSVFIVINTIIFNVVSFVITTITITIISIATIFSINIINITDIIVIKVISHVFITIFIIIFKEFTIINICITINKIITIICTTNTTREGFFNTLYSNASSLKLQALSKIWNAEQELAFVAPRIVFSSGESFRLFKIFQKYLFFPGDSLSL